MKRFFREYKFVWISYLVLFLIRLVRVLMTSEDTIITDWGTTSYSAALFFWGTLYGFTMGAYIQYKARNGWIKNILKTVIYFICLMFLVLLPALRPGLREIFFSSVIFDRLLYITLISWCFFIAQTAVKIARASKKGEGFLIDTYIAIFILFVIGELIPIENDIIWAYGFLFHLPFLVFGAHVLGLILGIKLQVKRDYDWIMVLLSAAVHFLIIFLIFLIPYRQDVIHKKIGDYAIYTFAPAGLSAFCFLLGEVIVKVKGIIKNKQKTV